MRMLNMTEKELVRRCKKKNAKAQKLLYQLYHGSLLGICMRYAKSKAEAEDVLQMAMMKIYTSINSFSGKGSFEGWLKRITVNTAVDNFRKNSKHYYHDDVEDLEEQADGDVEFHDTLEVKDILKTIQQLPDGYRVVFNLYALEGYSHKEIAEKLGITESTSKTQLLKARKKLKNMLTNLNRMPERSITIKSRAETNSTFINNRLIMVDLILEK